MGWFFNKQPTLNCSHHVKNVWSTGGRSSDGVGGVKSTFSPSTRTPKRNSIIKVNKLFIIQYNFNDSMYTKKFRPHTGADLEFV